jgi:hypothetical protein
VAPDGSLIVGGSPVFAGEAHVMAIHPGGQRMADGNVGVFDEASR